MAGRKVFVDLDVLTAAELNGYLMDQSVMSFANAAARDAAIPVGQRKVGMVTFVQNTRLYQVWMDYGTWSGWHFLPGTVIGSFRQNATQNIVTATWTQIILQATIVDLTNGMNADRVHYVPGLPGTYKIEGLVCYISNPTGARQQRVDKTGVAIPGSYGLAMAAGAGIATAAPSGTAVIALNATDNVELWANQNSGATLATVATAACSTLHVTLAGY